MRINIFSLKSIAGILLGFFTFLPCLFASELVFSDLFCGQHKITVEIANTAKKREIGLMHRRHLGAGMGMLFLFPDSDYRSFWMKNTLIELDIIYLDSSKRIIYIHSHVPPCVADPCPSYPSPGPAQYVLELDGGESERLGLVKGERMDFIIPSGTVVE